MTFSGSTGLSLGRMACVIRGHDWLVRPDFEFKDDVWLMFCGRCGAEGEWDSRTDTTKLVKEAEHGHPAAE